MAALLLPLITTSLTWVTVELLVRQTDAFLATSDLATDTVDIVLQSQERSEPHSRQDCVISNTSDQNPSVTSATHAVDIDGMERDLRPNETAVLNARKPQVTVTDTMTSAVASNECHLTQQPQSTTENKLRSQHDPLVEPDVNVADSKVAVEQNRASNRRPTVELRARHGQFLEAEVYDVQPHRTDSSKFQSLNTAACAMMYIAQLCFSFSILCCKLLVCIAPLTCIG